MYDQYGKTHQRSSVGQRGDSEFEEWIEKINKHGRRTGKANYKIAQRLDAEGSIRTWSSWQGLLTHRIIP